jgi:hypothetical protein
LHASPVDTFFKVWIADGAVRYQVDFSVEQIFQVNWKPQGPIRRILDGKVIEFDDEIEIALLRIKAII